MLAPGKIAVIILNWNNAPDTLECLESVYQSEDPHYQVYVVDNGSKDDSLSILQKAHPQVSFLPLDQNYGFTGGNNRAMQKAIDEGAEYLFLLNNDATVRKNTLSLLRQAAEEHPNAAALSPKIYYYDSPTTLCYAGGGWSSERVTGYPIEMYVEEQDSNVRSIAKTFWAHGCALLIRVALVKNVGLFDPRYFLNWEEIDWCFRMRKAGLDCLIVPEAKAWHKVSQSFIGGNQGPMWTYFYYRNRLLWMQTHLSWRDSLEMTKRVLWPQFLDRWKNRKDEVSRAALRGIRDFFLRRFGAGSARTH